MSHNTTRVKNVSPNAAGDINLSIDDLLDNTPTSNQIVKYQSGTWAANSVGVEFALGYGYHYFASGGSGGSYTFSTGDRYIWRGSGNINTSATGFSTVTSTSTYTPITNNRWWMGFNMPEGKWLISWQFNVYMESSTSYSTWRFATAPNSGSNTYTYHSAQSYVQGTQSRFGGLIRCIVNVPSGGAFGCLVNQARSGSIRLSPSGSAHYVNAINIISVS
jgi:hypothetical protein